MIPQPAKSTKAYKVKTELEFGNYLVKSGKERDTDILLIGFLKMEERDWNYMEIILPKHIRYTYRQNRKFIAPGITVT